MKGNNQKVQRAAQRNGTFAVDADCNIGIPGVRELYLASRIALDRHSNPLKRHRIMGDQRFPGTACCIFKVW